MCQSLYYNKYKGYQSFERQLYITQVGQMEDEIMPISDTVLKRFRFELIAYKVQYKIMKLKLCHKHRGILCVSLAFCAEENMTP